MRFVGEEKQHNDFNNKAFALIRMSRHLIQPISHIQLRNFPFMNPSTPQPPPPQPNKNTTHQQRQRKSRLLLKHHSFSEESEMDESQSCFRDSQCQDWKGVRFSEEDMNIISLFKKEGPNWQSISKQIQGNTVLETKRHFFQIFRTLITNLNHKLRKIQHHQISFNKLKTALKLTSSQDTHEDSSALQTEICTLMEQCLLNEQPTSESVKASVKSAQKILHILKQHRKKTSNKHSADVLSKQPLPSQQQQERGYLSDSSSVFQQGKVSEERLQMRNVENGYADEQVMVGNGSRGVVVEQSQLGIKQLLRESGVLQVQQTAKEKGTTQCHQSIPSSSQNLNNQSYQHFFQQSELEHDCYWKKSCSSFNPPS